MRRIGPYDLALYSEVEKVITPEVREQMHRQWIAEAKCHIYLGELFCFCSHCGQD